MFSTATQGPMIEHLSSNGCRSLKKRVRSPVGFEGTLPLLEPVFPGASANGG